MNIDWSINPIEIGIGIVVILALVAVRIINHYRKDEQGKVKFNFEIVTVLATLVILVIYLVVRSGIVQQQPLLFGVGVICLITAVASTLDAISTIRLRHDLDLIVGRLGNQVAGLGNLQFFSTKEEAFNNLSAMTIAAREKLFATRFSPADISIENEYFSSIKQRAFDARVSSIRIHSLAHQNSSCVEGICRLIYELKGARQFQLGVAFFNNSFEMIIADDKDCIFCFHDVHMTIKNGFKVDSNLPSSAHVVENMGVTFRKMLDDCYLLIDFEKFVRTDEDVRKLQDHLRKMHSDYCNGKIPMPVHSSRVENYLRESVFNTTLQ